MVTHEVHMILIYIILFSQSAFIICIMLSEDSHWYDDSCVYYIIIGIILNTEQIIYNL